jgi:hypothetical protein
LKLPDGGIRLFKIRNRNKTGDGSVKLEVYFDHEDLWLTQKKMAELFEIDVRTVNDHLKNIFESEELDQNSTIRKTG